MFDLLKIDDYKNNLYSNRNALRYLAKRGFNGYELIEKYNVGCTNNYITLPIYHNNKSVFLTSRSYTNKEPIHRHLNGNINYFYNHPILKNNLNDIIITESPIDCLSLIYRGFNAIGCFGVNGYPKNLKEMFGNINDIIIIFDNDESGYKGTIKLAEKIFLKTNKVIRIGKIKKYNDVNDAFVNLNKSDFIENIKSISTFANKFVPKPIKEKRYNNAIKQDQYPILDIISRYVNHIERKGNVYMCCCPFHYDKTPSLSIYQTTNSFYCFGCGIGGSPVNFIKNLYPGCRYKDAFELLKTQF